MLLRIAAVFGHHVSDHSLAAQKDRVNRLCPFRGKMCNKTSVTNPLGTCSFEDDTQATAVCPARFLEKHRIFIDAGKLAFGAKKKVVAIPEIRVLRIEAPGKKPRKIGKIDFMLTVLDENGKASDFAALEVQSVYISGKGVRSAFEHYLKKNSLPANSERRMDFRSSAQKRLMPQLSLKVPVFRRWGKKFFVAVDQTFFDALPVMQTVDGIENSEVTWLVYSFTRRGNAIEMGTPRVVFTHWEAVLSALREGVAPRPNEVLAELEAKLDRGYIVNTP
jgi:hypothetical protein